MIRTVCVALSVAVCLGLAGCGSAPLVPSPEAPATSSAPVGGPPADAVVVPPTDVEIPSIGAASTLVATGLNEDGTAEVPPVDQPLQASYLDWADEIELERPLVVLGHVDGRGPGGRSVPGVFAKLSTVAPGAEVRITRADGAVEVYVVTEVEKVDKDAFPTAKVYDIAPGPALRLVTCGGEFNRSTRHYEDNWIVYADQRGAL